MKIPTELMEMKEQTFTAEELSQQTEIYESELKEAVEEGSTDMAEYYREKLKQLEEVRAAQSDEIHFGGYYAGRTGKEWRDKARDEYVANGDSVDYRRYKENAIKAECG